MDGDETQITNPLDHLRGVTYQIIGGFYTVYNQLGFGFLEKPCANALAVELAFRGLNVEREVPFEIVYRGVSVGVYRVDLLVEGRVIVEVKASKDLSASDEPQLLNYLKASSIEIGLLLHFGPKARYRRLVYSNSRK
jgi:GxxExxY protein